MFVRRTLPGPIAIADATGSVLLDVPIAVHHVSGKSIITHRFDQTGLSRMRPTDTDSPLQNLESAGVLKGHAYGLVLRQQVELQEEVITTGRPVSVLGHPRRSSDRVVIGSRGVLSAVDPQTWISTLAAEARSSAALLWFFPIGAVIGAFGTGLVLIGLR